MVIKRLPLLLHSQQKSDTIKKISSKEHQMKRLILLLIMLSPFIFFDKAMAELVDTEEVEQDNSGYEDARFSDPYRHHSSWSGNMNFFIGEQEVSDKDWTNLKVDSLTSTAFKLDFKEETWPISITIDLLFAYDSNYSVSGGYKVSTDIEELAFGVKKIIEAGPGFNLYFGGGVSLVTADMEFDFGDAVASDSDSDIGQWLEAGFYVTLSEQINLGLSLRYLDAEVVLFDEADDISGLQTGAFIGAHF